MQLAREGSPPSGLRIPQTELSRKSNQAAGARIRRFESDMPSHAVGSLCGTFGRRRDALGRGFLLAFSKPSSYHTPHPTPPLGQYAFPHVRQSLKKVFPELISVGVPL
jgi:hypothetical protein